MIGARPTHWITQARRFPGAREAVAAVEFALVMPLLLMLYLGSLELSQLINIDQRVTNIAGTVGDLVSRTNGTIAAATLTDYFKAATAIISPFPTTGLTQVVTLVKVDASTSVATVVWSQAYNGGTAKIVNSVYGPAALPTAITSISKGSYVVVSEANYPYLPLLGLFFKSTFNLYHQNFYAPRYASKICYVTPDPCT